MLRIYSAGVVHLKWSGEGAELERLDHREALRRLLALRSEKGYPRDPRRLLDLAALPTLCLWRPRTMSGLHDSVALVQRVLVGESSDAPGQSARAKVSVASRHDGRSVREPCSIPIGSLLRCDDHGSSRYAGG